MSTNTTREQERWMDLVRDPALQDLTYKVETNAQGQILLSPRSNRHSFLQGEIQRLLHQHAPSGSTPPEFAIATPHGAEEVWLVDLDGRVRFFGKGEMDGSEVVPGMPGRL